MGNLINFYSPSAANINSLKVHFAPKQDEQGQTGKNLLNRAWFTATNSYLNSSGVSGTMSYFSYTDYITLEPNTYTISGVNNTVNSNLRIHSYDENKEWVKQLASVYITEGNSFSLTFTVTSDDKYLRISAPAKTPENPYLQLEVGSSATAYEPYIYTRQIEGWEGLETYKAGKNLYKPEFYKELRYNTTIGTTFNVVKLTDVTENNNIFHRTVNSWGQCSLLAPVIAGQTYTMKAKISAIDLAFCEYMLDKNYKVTRVLNSGYFSPGSPYNLNKTFVVQNNEAYMAFYIADRQKGEITIENPQLELGSTATFYEPYCGQTYPVEFPVVGKNITQWILPDGMTVTKNYNGNNNWHNGWIPPTSANGKQITYSVDIDNTNGQGEGYIHIWTKDANDSYVDTTIISTAKIAAGSSGRIDKTITINTDRYKTIIFGLTLTAGATASHPMVEYGSSSTTYEPYSSNNTIYGGYVDLVEGKVVAENAIVDLGDFSWNSDSNRSGVFYASMANAGRKTSSPIIACSRYEVNNQSVTTEQDGYISGYWSYAGTAPFIRDSQFSNYTTAQVKEALVGTKAIIVLDTPLEYPITPQILTTFHGINNIWSNTGSDTEIFYDLYETSRLTTIKKRIIAAAPHVNTTSTANTVSFTTDMRAPLPQCKVSFMPRQGGSGTASPTNVRPIYGLKYLSVLNSGKNLVDVSTFTIGKGLNSSGQLQNWDSTMLSPYIPLPGGNYYVSAISRASGSNNLRIHGFDENKQWIKQIIAVSAEQNAEYAGAFDFSSSNIKYIRVSVNINTENLQIEQGTSKSQYEPYSGGLWTADWESAAGEVYGGYVDLVKGKLVVEWVSVTATYADGEGTFVNNRRILYKNIYSGYVDESKRPNLISNIGKYGTGGAIPYCYVTNLNTLNEVQVQWGFDDSYTDAITAQVVYPLATPQIYSLTPTQLLSFKGTNNLYASHNTITAKYWTH